MKMPRYYFVVRAQDHTRLDPGGMILAGPHTANEHAHRIISELKAVGCDPPSAVLDVLDETGKTIRSIPF
jgi:hypothetical protein